MGDSIVTIVAVVLAAILMFAFPLMSIAERTDNISQLSVQSSTDEFINKVRTTGKITWTDYEKLLGQINATGNSFEIELTIQNLDENPGVKTTQAERTKIGENLYYTEYTSQVMKKLSANNRINLKEGDIVTVSVKNTNETIAEMLRNFFYSVSGNESPEIMATATATIGVNGSTIW